MSKLYAIRQAKFDKYWYDFVEDFTSPTLDSHCVSGNLDYVKKSHYSLISCNPAWKDSEIVELGIIADLEAKLAESEKEKQEFLIKYKHWRTECAKLEEQLNNSEQKCLICNKDQENEQLKKQLAEKEEEIEKLTEELDDKNFCKDFVDLYSENKLKTQMLHKNWKDKISFCIEKLEKVKEKVICGVLDTSNGFWDFTLKNGDAYILDDALLDLLEQEFTYQIKELKKEMK